MAVKSLMKGQGSRFLELCGIKGPRVRALLRGAWLLVAGEVKVRGRSGCDPESAVSGRVTGAQKGGCWGLES